MSATPPTERAAPDLPTSPPAHQVTRANVIAGVERAVNQYIRDSDGHDGDIAPFRLEQRIDEYLSGYGIDLWDDIVPLDFAFRIERELGAPLARHDVYFAASEDMDTERDLDVFRNAFTFARLIDNLCATLTPAPIRPATIFGRRDATAGAFDRIADMVRTTRAAPIAPSMRIRETLCGMQLDRLWRWAVSVSDGRVPPMKPTPRSRAWKWSARAAGVALFIKWAGWMLTMARARVSFGWCALVTGIVIAAGMLAYRIGERIFGRTDDRIPGAITTFADLARLISGEWNGLCHACGYNLTGAGNACPECGQLRHEQS